MKSGESRPKRNKIDTFTQKRIRILCHVVANGQRRLIQLNIHRGLQDHVGEIVNRISSRCIKTADADVLEHGIPRRKLCGHFILKKTGFGKLDPQTVDQLLRFVRCDAPGLNISLVEGP